jgi:predicted DNA-binding protein with PD1-like motif
LRLKPGQDLRQELEAFAVSIKMQAGLVLTCVGSLTRAALRLADADSTTLLEGKFEIVSLVGTFSPDGAHLHISISDTQGDTYGGHLQEGALVYTTAEIVLADLEEHNFNRRLDTETGYDELYID